jgi:hypothetical protein
MQEEFTAKSVVDQYSPIWAELKAVIDQYPDVFSIHCGMGGYIMEVNLGTLEKQLESKRQLFKMVNEIQNPKAGSFMANIENELLSRISKESDNFQDILFTPRFNTLNLSNFQALLQSNDYTQETIQEITNAIESYQSSLTAKRIALKSLTNKIAECKELAQIVYGKDIKVDIVFNHE